MGERDSRRTTFDEAALLYDQARPGYPPALFDDIVSLSHLPPGGRILEIGCGTGQATVPFARRGYRMLCVELGASLAAVARRNLAAYPQVAVRAGAFEDWPVEEDAFDLAICATAFHWLDAAMAYGKTAQALKAGGAIAVFWNLHVQGDAADDFFLAVQEVYRREAPTLAAGDRPLPRHDEIPSKEDEIAASRHFGDVVELRYRWEATYDAAAYCRLLNTYSDHRSLESAARQRLLDGIAALIDTCYNGRITKNYLTTLYAAPRL